MKSYRGTFLALIFTATALPIFGCGNALEGGSSPSGSYIRVESVSPTSIEPDLYRTVCSSVEGTDGAMTYTYEANAVKNHYASVTLRNEDAPNTPSGSSTNSYVTMNRYTVSFTGVSKKVTIPKIDGGSLTVGIPADTSGVSTTVLVMDLDTLEYIREHYPTIGNGESLTLRATITLYGEDSFKVTVSTQAQVTLVIDDYTTCS